VDRDPGWVLFHTGASTGRLRLSGGLVGWYLLVALLHTLWDASRGIAVWLTLLLDALLGVAVLRGRWRQALALERVQPAPGPTP
jgi:hypothetical protein